MQIQADDALSPIGRLAIDKLMAFEEETGQPLEVFQPGSIKVARAPGDEAQLHTEVSRGRATGVDVSLVSAEQARALAPWFSPSGARAMWFAPHDIYLEPGDLPRAYVRALRDAGATIREHAEVMQIGLENGRAAYVELSDGERIEAGATVLAAGAWTLRLTDALGIALPMWPVRHQLLITEPLHGVTNAQPAVRIMDSKCYVRPCRGGLLFGSYEPHPLQPDPQQWPPDYRVSNMPLDLAPLRARMDEVAAEFPSLHTATVAELRGGFPNMTPDSHFLVGPVGELDGLWVISGDNVRGLSTSPALGAHLARWIAAEYRHDDLVAFDPSRFGDRFSDRAELRRACLSTYVDRYSDAELAIR
jgi:glycine/D-amino acid oxidase-like deaminating enzyme